MTINPFEAHMGSRGAAPARRVAVDAAVLAGFRLIRREPLAVLAWGLVAAVFSIASVALFAPVYADMLSVWRAALNHGPGHAPPAPAADGLRFQGLGWLLTIASLILRAVLVAAVCRAVQRPNERRFAYLRLGMAEFFLLLIYLGFYLAAIVSITLIVFIFAVATFVLSLGHAWPVALALDIVGGLAAVVGVIYLALRLSLIAPLVVADDKPHLAASWSLTRGHTGALLRVGVYLFGLIILAQLLIVGLVLAVGGGALAGVGGMAGLIAGLASSPDTMFSHLAPYLAGLAIAGAPVAGCLYAILSAPWARVFLDLGAGGAPAE